MSSKLDFEKFRIKLGTWSDYLKPAFAAGLLDSPFAELKSLTARGREVAPLSKNLFRPFIETPYKECYAVLICSSAYDHKVNDECVADGLALSAEKTIYLTPELKNLYGGIEKDLCNGLSFNMLNPSSLRYLAKEGVLLLNAGMTTEIGKFGSHIKLWQPFIEYLCTEVFSILGIPVILMGKETWKFEKNLAPFQWVFKVEYPKPEQFKEWEHESVFSKVKEAVKGMNGKVINWWQDDGMMPF